MTSRERPSIHTTELHACARVPLVFATTTTTRSSGVTEDRVVVTEHGDTLVIALADGAGGMRGGSTASDAFVSAVRTRLASAMDPYDLRAWSETFTEIDAALARGRSGETTGVLVVVGAHGLMGISVGDSEAWVVTCAAVDDLTEHQRSPRLGSGRATPTPFHRRGLEGTLVVASDGLFAYVDAASIVAACEGPVDEIAEQLSALPRLASGAYPDDLTAVVVESLEA